jgi:predicted dehydrogenase
MERQQGENHEQHGEKVLGAAIFGAGWVAGEHAKAYQQCARTRLVAVGSRKEESARRCAEYGGAPDAFLTTDFEALLQHPTWTSSRSRRRPASIPT